MLSGKLPRELLALWLFGLDFDGGAFVGFDESVVWLYVEELTFSGFDLKL